MATGTETKELDPSLDFKHQLEQALKHVIRLEISMDVQILDGVDGICGNLKDGQSIKKEDLKILIEHLVKSPVRINLSRLRNVKAALDNIIIKM